MNTWRVFNTDSRTDAGIGYRKYRDTHELGSYVRCTLLRSSGGSHQEVGDEHCTHLVVEENSVKELPFTPTKKLFVVKQEVRGGVGGPGGLSDAV